MVTAALISLGSESSKLTLEAMKKYFEKVDHIDLQEIEVNFKPRGCEVLWNGEKLPNYDCIYVKGSFRYSAILSAITSSLSGLCYMPLKGKSFSRGHDKLLTQLYLQQSKIPMPKSYLASSPHAAKKILERLNYPILMKFPQSTHGKGVMYADSFASANSMLDALTVLNQPFIIQEYVDTSGSDLRAIVVGDKVVASMRRKAKEGEVRANIHAGAIGEPVELDGYTKKIAVDAAQALGAEICGVDILEGPKGPVVIELNLSPGLQGITEITKVNVADKIADYLYKKALNFAEQRKSEGKNTILRDLGVDDTAVLLENTQNEIITHIDFRANRMLLPELLTDMSGFSDKKEVSIKAKKGQIEISESKQDK
ncbi:RimK family alpha-L-glutamate ligase [Nanoarchaeota archaeon]